MALTADEQDLFDEARAALPPWFRSLERANEELGMMAKIFGGVLTEVRDIFAQTYIKQAEGATSVTPDWLAQHAVDRGSRRQAGESDQALRDRLRKFEHGLTRAYLLSFIQSMMTTYGIAGTPYMVELSRDAAWLGTVTAMSGTGGTFAGPTSGAMTFTPTVRFAGRPYVRPTSTFDMNGESALALTPNSGRVVSWQMTFSGASSGGNNGTFATTGLSGDAVKYANGSGVAGADAGVTWTATRKDWQGVVMDGHADTFLSRGMRLSGPGSQIIVILPYGTTEPQRKSIAEMVRTKKGAGIILLVERRQNP